MKAINLCDWVGGVECVGGVGWMGGQQGGWMGRRLRSERLGCVRYGGRMVGCLGALSVAGRVDGWDG